MYGKSIFSITHWLIHCSFNPQHEMVELHGTNNGYLVTIDNIIVVSKNLTLMQATHCYRAHLIGE